MDRLTTTHLDEHGTLLLGAVGAATLFFLYLLLRADAEAPVPYTLPPPEQAQAGWRGPVLAEPTLKVCCPAFPKEAMTSARPLPTQY